MQFFSEMSSPHDVPQDSEPAGEQPAAVPEEAPTSFLPAVPEAPTSFLPASPTVEMVDVLDEHGQPTGERLPKDEVHAHGLWHADVHTWLTTGTHFVEQLRNEDKDIMPDVWDISASGHLLPGETPLEGAQRETGEELGRHYPPERFIPIGKLSVAMEIPKEADEPGTATTWVHRTVGENFVVVDPDLQVEDLTIQESEVAGVRLYPMEQLIADILDAGNEGEGDHAPQPMSLWQLGIQGMLRSALDIEPEWLEPEDGAEAESPQEP